VVAIRQRCKLRNTVAYFQGPISYTCTCIPLYPFTNELNHYARSYKANIQLEQ